MTQFRMVPSCTLDASVVAGDFPGLVDLCLKLASGMEWRTGQKKVSQVSQNWPENFRIFTIFTAQLIVSKLGMSEPWHRPPTGRLLSILLLGILPQTGARNFPERLRGLVRMPENPTDDISKVISKGVIVCHRVIVISLLSCHSRVRNASLP